MSCGTHSEVSALEGRAIVRVVARMDTELFVETLEEVRCDGAPVYAHARYCDDGGRGQQQLPPNGR